MWIEITTKKDVSDKELGYVVDKINKMLHAGEFQEIDDLLRDADVGNTSIVVMIACLRVPFVVRDRLPNWKPYLQRCYTAVQNLGQDADRLFRGLY